MKKVVIIIITILLISLSILGIFIFKPKPKVEKVQTIDKQEYILEKTNNAVTKEFLKWLNKDDELYKYLKSNDYDISMWHKVTGNSFIVLNDQYNNAYDEMDNVQVINDDESSISFIGDVSLADNWYVMPQYDSRGKKIYGILSEEVVNELTSSSLTVANNEFTISNRGFAMPGKTYTFRANPERLKIYEEMGVDLVTLANNHVYDFGSDAFNDMLEALNQYNIPHIGAGKNISEASKPYYFILNGYKIAFVNATRAEKNILTPGATETEEGVLRCYDTTNFVNTIKEVKQNSDYVIALVHYGQEFSHQLEDAQIASSKEYIDAGADLVVGSHAHVLQGFEYYNNKLIAYNLGDFIFNNESKETGIFKIKLNDDGTMEYYFVPCYESEEYTKTLEGNAKQELINNMNGWSINATLDAEGKISMK